MHNNVYIIIGVSIVLGLLLLWRGISNFLTSDLHKFRGIIQLALSVACVGVAALLGVAAINLSAYHHLTQETALATIEFEELRHDKGRYIATLNIKGDDVDRRFELQGDQWQIDVRVIKWHNELSKLGLKPLYQFDRLSGRHSDIEKQKITEQTLHSLAIQKGVDVWSLADGLKTVVQSFVDTSHGSSTYQPMRNGWRYEISLTNSGLVSRPIP